MNKFNITFKNILFYIIIIIFILSIVSGINIFLTISKYNASIFPDVHIESIDVGGLTKEQALSKLQSIYNQKLDSEKVIVKVEDKTFELPYSSLGINLHLQKSIDDAYNFGRTLNIIDQYQSIKKPSPTNIILEFDYDTAKVAEFIDTIYSDVYVEPKDATIRKENGNFIIEEEVIGLNIDKEKLKEEISSAISVSTQSNLTINLDIIESIPSVTSNELKSINTKISSYVTSYSISDTSRVENIYIATNFINGVVVHPGDEFSFNEIVGQRTREKGYKDSKIILNNKFTLGIAGGICQVSSTLFNAVLQANIPYTQREHHTLPSSYVPLGLDATVTDGGKDFKFVNTLPYPIFIEGFCSNNKLYFNIYSDKSLAKTVYKVTSKVTEIVPNKIKYVNDPLLYKGVEQVEVPGTKGYHVDVYLTGYENGKTVSNKLLYKDYYKPIDKVIRVGTAK